MPSQLIATGNEGGENSEVDEVPFHAQVEWNRVSGSLEDKRSKEVRSSDHGLAPVMVDGDQLSPVDCLVGSSGLQGGGAGDTTSVCGPLTDLLLSASSAGEP